MGTELYSTLKQRRMIRIVHTAADLWGKHVLKGPHDNNIPCKGWALTDKSPRGELSESSFLTSPLASERRTLWVTSQAWLIFLFPGTADHCHRKIPSIREDFSCLFCCWCSCLAFSSPSLHTSLWCKPYSLEGGPTMSAQRGRGVVLTYLLLLDGGARLCKYKLFFCLVTHSRYLTQKIELRHEKEFVNCVTKGRKISLRLLH